MTDGQSLLVILGAIYLSECVVWLPKGAIVAVIPLFGRPIVRAASWAGNDNGGFAFTTLIPARAIFVCNGSDFDIESITSRVSIVVAATRGLRALTVTLFATLFLVAPALTWWIGFARIGLLIIVTFAIANVTMAIAFYRAQKRIDPTDPWFRWTHAIVMLIATPAAIRAVDYATRNTLRDFDPLAVAAAVLGAQHPTVARMLRELAYPAGGADSGSRYDAARNAGLVHVETPPDGAAAYCPRCLSAYEPGHAVCADCDVALIQSPIAIRS